MIMNVNQYLNVIPTPMQFVYSAGDPLKISNVCCKAQIGKPLKRALELLSEEQEYTFSEAEDSDLIITDKPLAFFSESDLSFFREKYAEE